MPARQPLSGSGRSPRSGSTVAAAPTGAEALERAGRYLDRYRALVVADRAASGVAEAIAARGLFP